MIELKELTLGYGQRTLLKTVNARITGGQLVALLGRNGTGKSTLLRAIMGLESPQSGEINLQGKDIASLKPEKLALSISFVTTDKVRIANLRCKDVVALGRAPYTNWLGLLQPEDRKIVDNAIQLVGEYIRGLHPAAACALASLILYLFWLTLSFLLLLFSLYNLPNFGLMICVSMPLLSITILFESVGITLPSQFATLGAIQAQVYEHKFQYIGKAIAGYVLIDALLIVLMGIRVKRMDVRFMEKE